MTFFQDKSCLLLGGGQYFKSKKCLVATCMYYAREFGLIASRIDLCEIAANCMSLTTALLQGSNVQ